MINERTLICVKLDSGFVAGTGFPRSDGFDGCFGTYEDGVDGYQDA